MTKGDETKAAILPQAMALASQKGLEALSIGELAKVVGMSKSGLFAHFDSKENLQLQVLATAAEYFVETVVSPAFKAPRGIPRLRALFDNWLRWAHDPNLPGGCLFLAVANELDDRPGPVRDRLVAYQRDWFDTLANAARIAIKEGHFRDDLDGAQFAYDFYSVILAYHHFHRLIRDPQAETRARSGFERLLDDAATAQA